MFYLPLPNLTSTSTCLCVHYDKIFLGKKIFNISDQIFLEAPVGYVQEAPEDIGTEASDSKISAGDFGELLGRLGEGFLRIGLLWPIASEPL
ncbi:hypothetical protein CROQUDRAFT_650589 [Cronartium quercuum f. sp. fusiforme G11]|uniref:Uncharacterized protein n=1 Tax=Cronartium quercuum f. sp. fusiforme G11 TaxID=708437 RepID=A0A9P6THE7_9BASI|nr:hypothetical protein CROQUDRAFT_650589 [Cronartium quercuum f. sp. fusiforme G11]